MCRKQFGYQVLFSSVFFFTFNTSYNFVFYAIIIIIIIIIHWELLCVCVCVYIEMTCSFKKGRIVFLVQLKYDFF